MFNKKAKRVIAIIGLVVMCVATMASCQVGGTYAEKPGNADLIQIAGKKPSFQEYTGDRPIKVIDTTDPAYKPQSNNGGSTIIDDDDDNTGDVIDDDNNSVDGNENVGDVNNGDVNNGDENNGAENNGDENNGDVNNGDENNGDENNGEENNGAENNGDENTGDEEDEEEEEEEEEEVRYDENNKLKIVAYNLRCANDSGTYGGTKEISDRMPRFKEKVMDVYQPDVVGMSECVPKHIEFLNTYSNLSYGSYKFHYTWRSGNSKETTPIMWNANKLEEMGHGTFWLSDTPDSESKADSWGAEHWRVVCWAKLKVKATGKIFVFFSTHFDFNPVAHVNSVKTIQKKATELGAFSKYGFFFVGDCNMQPWKEGYNAVYEIGMADINFELTGDNGPGTCNGYHTGGEPEGEGGGSTIDYIFYTPNKIHPLHYEVIDKMGSDGDWISDHRGLYAEAALL